MTKQRHSRSYHRYFENYAERETVSSTGKTVIERVYVGQYYAVDLPEESCKKQKILIGILGLLSLAGYLIGALTAKVSAVSLVAIGTMPPLIALIFLMMALYYRLSAPKEMEIRTFRDSSVNLIRSSLAFLICQLLCLALTVVGCVRVPGYSLLSTLPSLLLYLAASGAALAVYLIEKKTKYRTLPPKHQRPEKSSPIRFEEPD